MQLTVARIISPSTIEQVGKDMNVFSAPPSSGPKNSL